MLTKAQQQRVVSIWDEIEEEHSDVSTEMLFAMTCERASRELGVPVDNGDISGALEIETREGRRVI